MAAFPSFFHTVLFFPAPNTHILVIPRRTNPPPPRPGQSFSYRQGLLKKKALVRDIQTGGGAPFPAKKRRFGRGLLLVAGGFGFGGGVFSNRPHILPKSIPPPGAQTAGLQRADAQNPAEVHRGQPLNFWKNGMDITPPPTPSPTSGPGSWYSQGPICGPPPPVRSLTQRIRGSFSESK